MEPNFIEPIYHISYTVKEMLKDYSGKGSRYN